MGLFDGLVTALEGAAGSAWGWAENVGGQAIGAASYLGLDGQYVLSQVPDVFAAMTGAPGGITDVVKLWADWEVVVATDRLSNNASAGTVPGTVAGNQSGGNVSGPSDGPSGSPGTGGPGAAASSPGDGAGPGGGSSGPAT